MVRRHGPRALHALVAAVSLWAGAGHAERYTLTADNTLAVDREGRLVQSWSVSCVADNADGEAVISLSGKELRFFAAAEERLAVGVDTVTWPLGEVTGRYEYVVVPGARVMARLTARCGAGDVFDAIVVDSAPVIMAPRLVGPERIIASDTFAEVDGDALPVGRPVELVGLQVEGSPRGTEVVTVTIDGAGIDTTLTLGPADFVFGAAFIAPQLLPTQPGPIDIRVELLGASSSPLSLMAVDAGEAPEEPLPDDGLEAGAGCAASGAIPATVTASLALLGLCRRRRGSLRRP